MGKILKLLLPAILLFISFPTFAQTGADAIEGTYQTKAPFCDDVAKIKITKAADGSYRGRIVWVSRTTNADGTPRLDEKNPNPKLRTRKPTDITMFWNVRYVDGEWVNGVLYDPYSGKTFGIQFTKEKNSANLEARYYKGKPAVGITTVWKRVD